MAVRKQKFIKMEGIGNDYVFLDCLSDPTLTPEQFTENRIQSICDRHYGVGSDGLVAICRPRNAGNQARMMMWNADGSPSAMCGNALRCIALHVYRLTGHTRFTIESEARAHLSEILESSPDRNWALIKVDMGAPVFEAAQIPFIYPEHSPQKTEGQLIHTELSIDQKQVIQAWVLSMGNPHCVVFCEDADQIELEQLGPQLENHPAFPERTNVEFVSIDMNGNFYQRTWERGSGETLACGSGACAVAVAGVLSDRGQAKQRVRLRGGELELEYSGSHAAPASVFMSGWCRLVFEGLYLWD